MATPRNRKHAASRKAEALRRPVRAKGQPRAQLPPGNIFWMNGIVLQEAMMMAMVDESIRAIEPRLNHDNNR